MKADKRKRVQAAGFRVGSAREFLGLSKAEDQLIELHLALADAIRALRARARLTQQELARRTGTSQSRLAKIEAGDPSVSIDLQLRVFLSLAPLAELGRALSGRPVVRTQRPRRTTDRSDQPMGQRGIARR